MRKRTKERRRIPKRFFLVPFSVLFCLILSVPAFLPFPQRIPTEGDSYRCEWEDGSVSEENFAALYSDFVARTGNLFISSAAACTANVSFAQKSCTAR